jgi:hypothetical protein
MARRMPAALVARITAANLPHTCTVSARMQARDEDDAPDFDGHGVAETTAYAVAATGVPCSARQRPAQGEVAEPGRSLVAIVWGVRFAADAPIDADSQLSAIVDEAGAAVVAGPLTVAEVLVRRGHLLAVCDAAGLAGPLVVEDEEDGP